MKNPEIDLKSKERFINRELSWLNFNYRVLEEANNKNHPLLERLRFLAISDRNLDEFFMIRVGSLKKQVWAGINEKSSDGLNVTEQIEKIYAETQAMIDKQKEIWGGLVKELKHEQIEIIDNVKSLTPEEKDWLEEYFNDQIFPILTPLAVDPAHPFPLISSDAFALVLKLKKTNDQKDLNALVVIPKNFSRFINLNNKEKRFLLMETAINLFIDKLFPGSEIQDEGIFHIIREGDISIKNNMDDEDDLFQTFKDALKQRRHGEVIRLMVNQDMSQDLQNFVVGQLDINRDEIFHINGLMNFSDLDEFTKLNRPDLLFTKYKPRFPERITGLNFDYFSAIKAKDIVLHHPYESFDAVVEFLYKAALDPNVIAIKQTLYRTNADSPIVKALAEAAERGKAVTAMVELKARFDEEANISLSQILEKAGVQVVYGFINYKTHCKITLVVRKEGKEICNYAHFGTGNYNPVTAQIYTDLSLFTCDPAMCRDTVKIFNYLTGYAEPAELEKVFISPINLQDELLRLIDKEAHFASQGKPAEIWAKMNSLVDPKVIDSLYKASQAGVKIKLVVRGICCLRPGIKGLSENIEVKSIIGRFLEHARIVCFGNGHGLPSVQAKVFISSSDWMPRSFYHRVESLVPIENPTVHKQILEQVMAANLKDDVQSWKLNSDGSYTRVNGASFNAQNFFMTNKSFSGTSIIKPNNKHK